MLYVAIPHDRKEGVVFCQDDNPDLITADIVMPEKDAAETIMSLAREQSPPWPLMIVISDGGGQFASLSCLRIVWKFSSLVTEGQPFPPAQGRTKDR